MTDGQETAVDNAANNNTTPAVSEEAEKGKYISCHGIFVMVLLVMVMVSGIALHRLSIGGSRLLNVCVCVCVFIYLVVFIYL